MGMAQDRQKIDWNRLNDEQWLNGWRFDELVRWMSDNTGKFAGECGCDEPLRCVHMAAATLSGLLRIVEHGPDCPECAAARALATERADGGE